MSDIPEIIWTSDWQEARDICPDRPVVLVWVRGTHNGTYMRYLGELYPIDAGSYSYGNFGQRWYIAGVCFTPDSIYWMIDNAIAFPFSPEDLMLYYMTWGDCCE